MYGSPEIWSLGTLLDRLERKEILLDAVALSADPGPGAVLDFLESAVAGLPLGQLVLCERADGRQLVVVDGLQRIMTIVRVLRPDLFPQGDPWPVYLSAPDVPTKGRLLYGTEHGADPAAFPLSASTRTLQYLGWKADLENRTPDDERIKAARDGATRLNVRITNAKIFVWVIRDTNPASDEVGLAHRNANRLFNPGRTRPGR